MKQGTFIGGLGDFVLAIDNIVDNYNHIDIYTHQSSIEDLITGFNIPVSYNIFYDPYNHIPQRVRYPLIEEYTKYSSYLTKITELIPITESISFHRRGSAFHNNIMSIRNTPKKDFPAQFVIDIYDYCNSNKLQLNLLGIENDYSDIPKTIIDQHLVRGTIDKICEACLASKFFVGADSFFKTLRITTKKTAVIFLANYKDDFRKHIDPYRQDPNFKVLTYNTIEDIKFSTYLENKI